MCVKWWLQKFNSIILKTVNSLGFQALKNFVKVATLAASGGSFRLYITDIFVLETSYPRYALA